MNKPEPSFSVNVDLANPGQFFACCGLLELAHRLWPGAEGWFEDDNFNVACPKQAANALELLKDLSQSPLRELPGSEDAKLRPVEIGAPISLRLDWWLNADGKKSVFGKMFAGRKQTIIDARRLQDALKQALNRNSNDSNLFDSPWSQQLPGRFGVDPRTAWEALDVGFSPNRLGFEVETFLVVELVGAIGLQTFPPLPHNGGYHFATWAFPSAASVARAAACRAIPAPGAKVFQFRLIERGSYKGVGYAAPVT